MPSEDAVPDPVAQKNIFEKLELKDFALILPALATLLTMAYDVGYFFGIDIRFFTFFSLSEHIVFALHALPFAFLILGALITTMPIGDTSKRKWFDKAHPFDMATRIFLTIVAIAVAVWSVVRYGIASPICFLIVLVLAIIFSVERSVRSLSILGLGLLVFSFMLGADISRIDRLDPSFSHTIVTDAEFIEGKMVRAGERGVLFYDLKTKKFGMQRWEGIKRVISNHHDVTHDASGMPNANQGTRQEKSTSEH